MFLLCWGMYICRAGTLFLCAVARPYGCRIKRLPRSCASAFTRFSLPIKTRYAPSVVIVVGRVVPEICEDGCRAYGTRATTAPRYFPREPNAGRLRSACLLRFHSRIIPRLAIGKLNNSPFFVLIYGDERETVMFKIKLALIYIT